MESPLALRGLGHAQRPTLRGILDLGWQCLRAVNGRHCNRLAGRLPRLLLASGKARSARSLLTPGFGNACEVLLQRIWPNWRAIERWRWGRSALGGRRSQVAPTCKSSTQGHEGWRLPIVHGHLLRTILQCMLYLGPQLKRLFSNNCQSCLRFPPLPSVRPGCLLCRRCFNLERVPLLGAEGIVRVTDLLPARGSRRVPTPAIRRLHLQPPLLEQCKWRLGSEQFPRLLVLNRRLGLALSILILNRRLRSSSLRFCGSNGTTVVQALSFAYHAQSCEIVPLELRACKAAVVAMAFLDAGDGAEDAQ